MTYLLVAPLPINKVLSLLLSYFHRHSHLHPSDLKQQNKHKHPHNQTHPLLKPNQNGRNQVSPYLSLPLPRCLNTVANQLCLQEHRQPGLRVRPGRYVGNFQAGQRG